MTITPRLDTSIAGYYTKQLSDWFYLDKKDSEAVLELLKKMEQDVAVDVLSIRTRNMAE